MPRPQIGIWFIGARGSVATTTIVGWSALQRGNVSRTGLVSELPSFTHLQLRPWSDFVIGGHDIRADSLVSVADQISGTQGALPTHLTQECRRDLQRIDRNIRMGTVINVGDRIRTLADKSVTARRESAGRAVKHIQDDLQDFVRKNRLQNLVVVNLASTEPPFDHSRIPRHWPELESLLHSGDPWPLGASSLYAIAALDLGFPYINFTPSVGATPRAIRELAELRGTCHAGCDGKTGETLLKSVLAPMFSQRNLQVLSWVGHNIFGNLDGQILDDPVNKSSKIQSKDQLLRRMLGYSPQTLVSIEYIRSLGEWKTAWDHVHFQGFLDTPMTLQFVWQGCDSILAAPLVLDLVRFTQRAFENRQVGILQFLSCFFKSPLESKTDALAEQFALLVDWARNVPIDSGKRP